MSLLLAVGTAHAAYAGNSGAYSTSYVDGAGSVTDDFGDHFEELGNSLCQGCGESWGTDIVMLWQSILAAEHLLELSEIDGYFGTQTRRATVKWQSFYGLTADGKVGDKTWGKADDRLRWSNNGSTVGYISGIRYGSVTFHRGSSSKSRDGGAYHLHKVNRGDGVQVFYNGTRIHHRSKTIS
ncbi:peptidoglycan-binding domain-containing protein [Streptomyces sp. enrichment culture]|uniref:peptidoglycan-binding domain-containing protein n=1 Tax=Streptomyces sp. enrichment culture TaxID=1795815 RepID=UPI003F57BDF5